MAEGQSRKLGWGWALAGAVGAMASLIGAAILYMVIYGHLVHPGEAEAYYEEYAKRSSPVVCVVVGIPLFVLLAWRIGRRESVRPVATALLTCAFYILMDQLICIAMGQPGGTLSPIGVVSYGTKLLAALAGGVLALRSVAASPR